MWEGCIGEGGLIESVAEGRDAGEGPEGSGKDWTEKKGAAALGIQFGEGWKLPNSESVAVSLP